MKLAGCRSAAAVVFLLFLSSCGGGTGGNTLTFSGKGTVKIKPPVPPTSLVVFTENVALVS